MNDTTTASGEGRKKSQPKTREFPWYRRLIGIVLAACAYLVCSFFIWHPVICPRAHLYVGPKLAWRSYFWYGLNRWNYWAATGQLDQDADDELLVCLLKTRQTNSVRMSIVAFDADGNRKRWGTRNLEDGDGLKLWDYNADGRDDILNSHYD
jgi:hypothetical protein